MPNRSNPRIGLATAAGVIFALLISEISLRPWAGQLYRFDVQPLSADRIQAPTKIVRYYGEGIATSHFSPSRARLTGRAPVAGAPWIVIMGDSFVEGLQINDSETMGAVVERQAPVSAPINVRQYGWPGASPPKYVMEGPSVLRLWNPSMVAVIANANGFRTAALDTHWTTAQIRGDNFLIQPVSPNRLTWPVRVWFAMRRSALFEVVTSRFVLDISPEIPGVHTFHSTAEAAQRTPSDAEVLPMMVRLLKETYGDRLFLVYAAGAILDIDAARTGGNRDVAPMSHAERSLRFHRTLPSRSSSIAPVFRQRVFQQRPRKRPLQCPRSSPRRRIDLV